MYSTQEYSTSEYSTSECSASEYANLEYSNLDTQSAAGPHLEPVDDSGQSSSADQAGSADLMCLVFSDGSVTTVIPQL